MRLYLSSYRLGSQPEALLDLLGGGRRAAVVANAVDGYEDSSRRAQREHDDLRRLGLDSEELDLRRYFGRTEALAQRLAELDLLWVRGGNAFVLRRALRLSGADELLVESLAADALVYAGYSAGPAVLAPTLRGLHLVDDPQEAPDGYDPAVMWDGLAVLPYSFVPHYRSEHPESAAVEESVAYLIEHHLPFVALRDGEALVRDGAGDRVVGGAR
jgi:dipeptidase E